MKPSRFLIIIAIVAILGLAFSSFLNPARNIFLEVVSPFSRFFTNSGTRVGDFFHTIGSISQLAKDNKDLTTKNLELASTLANLKEVGHENALLKEELGFYQKEKENELVPSQVIGSSPSGFLQTIKVDKGTSDGVKPGSAVLSRGYLIGKVSQVNTNNSEIFLINNSNSLIPVVFQNSRGTGILKGGLSGMVVEDIALDSKIEIGEMVLTSGLGEETPAGLPIGTIEKILSVRSEIFQEVSVKSPIEFGKLEIVFIKK